MSDLNNRFASRISLDHFSELILADLQEVIPSYSGSINVIQHRRCVDTKPLR
jgi:hypothetical protein